MTIEPYSNTVRNTSNHVVTVAADRRLIGPNMRRTLLVVRAIGFGLVGYFLPLPSIVKKAIGICVITPIAVKAALNYFTAPMVIDKRLNLEDFHKCRNLNVTPEAPPTAHLDELRRIAQKYNKKDLSCKKDLQDPPYSMKSIEELIRRIENKIPFDSVPLNRAERGLWYQDLKNVVLNIVSHLQRCEKERNKQDIHFALANLSAFVNWCGSEWKTGAKRVLNYFQGKKEATLEENALGFVDQFRSSTVDQLAKPQLRLFSEDINPHVLNEATYQIHKHIHLPGGETANSDIGALQYHPRGYLTPNYFPREFFKKYTRERLILFFDELINGIKPDGRKTDVQLNREQMIDWFREKIRPFNPEEDIDFFMEHVFDKDRENCFKKEAIEYFLCKLGVLNSTKTPEEEFLGIGPKHRS